MMTHERRRETPATVTSLTPYTIRRRASNKILLNSILQHAWPHPATLVTNLV